MAEKGEPLSDRELAVLMCLANGSTNREIALDLDISPNTVKVHLRNIFAKLDVSSRTEAITVAMQQGLITVSGEIPDEATVEIQESSADPAQSQTDLSKGSTIQESRPVSHWRWIALVLVLMVVLLIGAFVGTFLLREEPATRAESGPTPSIEPYQVEALGDTNWFRDRPIPQERANMAVASIGLDLYLIGGEVGAGIINLVEVFETDRHLWSPATSKPTAVAEATGGVLFGEIIIPGGRLADDRPTAVVEAYSPANDAWRPVAPLPQPIAGGLTLSDGDLLYFFGGWDGNGYLRSAFAYDFDSDTWKELPPMEHARANAVGGLMDGRLFVIGGQNEDGDLAYCEYYDISSNEWGNCAPMSLPRAGAGAAVIGNNRLYVIGGGLQGEVSYAEVYNVDTDSWKQFDMPMLEEGSTWRYLGVANIETRIFAVGGWRSGAVQADNYVYEPFKHRTFLPTVGGDN
jgi:DNA-binding CsgD family transcriptional regulator